MPQPVSPRIAELQAAVSRGESAAVAAFWEALAASGAPIVEPIEGDPSRVLVTFAWRDGDAERRNVVLNLACLRPDPPNQQLARIDGTDVWYRTLALPQALRATYQFSPDDPLVSMIELSQHDAMVLWGERVRAWQADPLNAKRIEYFPKLQTVSVLELPHARPAAYVDERAGVPPGRIETIDYARAEGDPARKMWIYTPPGYDAGAGPYALALFFDGAMHRNGIRATFDNLIAERRVPPFVAVMMHQLDRDAELTCNDAFVDVVVREMLPWLGERYALTDDAALRVVGGTSYGAVASLHLALRHREAFANVISQSGSYWWGPGAEPPFRLEDAAIEWEWMIARAEASSVAPMRVYMNVGELEAAPRPGEIDMLGPNRKMRDVLASRGHAVSYDEYCGGHEWVCWRAALPEALAFAWENARG